jgi:hypothetical protein
MICGLQIIYDRYLTQQWSLASRLNDYWDEDMGALMNSTIYFQGYILKEISHPIVLALDGIDQYLSIQDSQLIFSFCCVPGMKKQRILMFGKSYES